MPRQVTSTGARAQTSLFHQKELDSPTVFNLGMGEITIIMLLALIFIGPKKLPELASGLGKLIREIRKTTADVKNEIQLDDSIRKPFEELREAVTLHPDELKRRDRLKLELAELRRKAEEAAAIMEANASQSPEEPPPELEGSIASEGGAEGQDPNSTAVVGHVATGAAHHDHDEDPAHDHSQYPAPSSEVGGEASGHAATPTAASAGSGPLNGALVKPPGPTIGVPPGAAPAGTVARAPSGAVAAPPAPPLAAVLAKGSGATGLPERRPAQPPTGSDFLRPSRAIPESRRAGTVPGSGPVPSGPPSLSGAADRSNITQTLTEADLAAITVKPPALPATAGQAQSRNVPPSPPPRLPGSTPPKLSDKNPDKSSDS